MQTQLPRNATLPRERRKMRMEKEVVPQEVKPKRTERKGKPRHPKRDWGNPLVLVFSSAYFALKSEGVTHELLDVFGWVSNYYGDCNLSPQHRLCVAAILMSARRRHPNETEGAAYAALKALNWTGGNHCVNNSSSVIFWRDNLLVEAQLSAEAHMAELTSSSLR